MKWPEKLPRWFAVPALTPGRIGFAFAVAVATDSLQLFLGPFGWLLVDEVLDVIAMVLTCWALGFHPLLLPTFIIELIPVADMLPTWTGCTAAVVMLRKRAARHSWPAPDDASPGNPSAPPVIDITEPPANR
jgi:hypothetical protein